MQDGGHGVGFEVAVLQGRDSAGDDEAEEQGAEDVVVGVVATVGTGVGECFADEGRVGDCDACEDTGGECGGHGEGKVLASGNAK